MKIQWLGHACFLITSAEGVRLLTDPFDSKVSYPPPAVEADIVTVSHQHFDHACTEVVKGKFVTDDQSGSRTVRGIEILGVPTFHDEAGGSKRGKNIMYRFTMDGLNIVHCGDLGHVLTPEQVQALGKVDVLIVPVGGHYTIDPAAAMQVVGQLKPALSIPMHFKTPVLDFPIQTVDPFLELAGKAGNSRRARSSTIEITRENLPDQAGVVVLDYPGA